MKPVMDFAQKLNAELVLDPRLVVEKEGRLYLLNKQLLGIARKDFFYAGAYLGKVKKGKFFPSFNLLALLTECGASSLVVDKKAEWLFICGRDIFRRGIVSVYGSRRKGDLTLVLNEFGECLGFGRIVHDLDEEKAQVAVCNISDVGDFLRRER